MLAIGGGRPADAQGVVGGVLPVGVHRDDDGVGRVVGDDVAQAGLEGRALAEVTVVAQEHGGPRGALKVLCESGELPSSTTTMAQTATGTQRLDHVEQFFVGFVGRDQSDAVAVFISVASSGTNPWLWGLCSDWNDGRATRSTLQPVAARVGAVGKKVIKAAPGIGNNPDLGVSISPTPTRYYAL